MRLTILLALAGIAFAADPIVVVGKARYVGKPVDAAAVAAGDGYLPVSLTQRRDPRGHLRILRLDARSKDEAKLRGDALAMARYGDSVYWAVMRSGVVSFRSLRYDGGRTRAADHGKIDTKPWGKTVLLAFAADRSGPIAVFKHAKSLEVVHMSGRKQTVRGTAPNGARYTAAAIGNGRVYAMGRGTGLLTLQRAGNRYVAKVTKWDGPAFLPRAMAVGGRSLAIGGTMGGGGVLAIKRARRQAMVSCGKGVVRQVAFLRDGRIAVAGSREGRAWVGVVAGRAITAQTYLPGNEVLSLGANPSGYGWSLLAGTNDNHVHVLRLRGDRVLPGDWNPFYVAPAPEPEPEPEPIPEPEPEPEPEPVRPIRPVQPVNPPTTALPAIGRAGTVAIFPRIFFDTRVRLDSEITLVYIGDRRRAVSLRYVDRSGRVVHVQRLSFRRGQRARVVVGDVLQRARIATFDGYVWIDGVPRADLVAEAQHVRGGRHGAAMQPHWR